MERFGSQRCLRRFWFKEMFGSRCFVRGEFHKAVFCFGPWEVAVNYGKFGMEMVGSRFHKAVFRFGPLEVPVNYGNFGQASLFSHFFLL